MFKKVCDTIQYTRHACTAQCTCIVSKSCIIKNPTFFEQSSALLVFSFWNFFTSVAFGKSTQQLKGAPVFFVIKWRVRLGNALFHLILSITSKRHFKTSRAIHSCVPEKYYMWWIVIDATWKWEHWKWTNKNFTIDIPVVYSVHWHHSGALPLHSQAIYKQTKKTSNFNTGVIYIIIEMQNQTLQQLQDSITCCTCCSSSARFVLW